MAEWFETKVKFLRQKDNGLIKSITEQYLVDSMSFTEAEGRVMTEVGEGMREVTVVSIKRSAIKETVMYGDTDMFFKVKVSYELMDEETEKSKKINTYLLVNAHDAKEAYERTEEHLKEMLVPFTITQISESPIIEVYQYQAGLSPGLRKVAQDFKGNMQKIADETGATISISGDGENFKEIASPSVQAAFDKANEDHNKVVNAGFSKESQSAKVPATDPTNGQAVHFDSDIEEGYTDLEERLENAMQPNPDYPVWLANQIQETFGWTLDVLQIRHIIEQHDTLPMVEFCRWIEMAYGASDKKIQACLKALKQPRE